MSKDERRIGRVLLWAVASAVAAVALSSCATLGQVPIRFCGSKDGFSACVDVGGGQRPPVPIGDPLPVQLPFPDLKQAGDPGREWCGGGQRYLVTPGDVQTVSAAGIALFPCALAETVEAARCGTSYASEAPTTPWAIAVRRGLVPDWCSESSWVAIANVIRSDEELRQGFIATFGVDPVGRGLTGPMGAEGEFLHIVVLETLWRIGDLDPARAYSGKATGPDRLTFTWRGTKGEVCRQRQADGQLATREHPRTDSLKPGWPPGLSEQTTEPWGCREWVLVPGEPPPPPPPPTSPCPAGESCQPPCPASGGPACPDLAKRIGEEIAAATADHRANAAKLLREIFQACSAPAPACPDVCPPVTIPAGEIGLLCEAAIGREVGPLVAEIGRLRGAVAALGTKAPPPECEGVLAQVESLGTLKVGQRVRWEVGRAAAVARMLVCLRALEARP